MTAVYICTFITIIAIVCVIKALKKVARVENNPLYEKLYLVNKGDLK